MDDTLAALAASPAALAALFLLVLADAFLVVVPREAAVTALAALSASTGSPALLTVIAVAAIAAACGDLACYAIGRQVGLRRWAWMRHPRAEASFSWAKQRLVRRSGTVLFTARFIPFARLAVNLTAGAVRMPVARYLPLAAAAAGLWAVYQSVIGVAIARLLPEAPAVAALFAVLAAVGIGAVIDVAIARRTARRGWQAGPMDAVALAPAGYDPAFLGVPIALPRPSGGRGLTRLDYPRFTVLLDTERRLAAATAVNIDGATLQDPPRTGQWRLDPRVRPDEQAGAELYADNDFDRGHLVRRRDPGWGTALEARAATEATFVYPNAAPQAAAFNQSKDLWVGLEDHVLTYADTTDQRLSVFTGPVLAADDPRYRGIGIPLRFWKIAAWSTDDVPAAAGFVLDQSALVDRLLREPAGVAPLGTFRTFQVPIADIAQATGLDLGPLVAADVLPPGDVPGGSRRELRRRTDIRL